MKKILVIRNDKIGDFMLAWPAFAMLKQSLPGVEITALVPSYTKALAALCPSIDKVLVDCGKEAGKAEKKALVEGIRQSGFDASICLFSDSYNATLVWKAGIPYRLAPATKISQFLYNHRITQRRSRSEKPEFQYNLDLVRAFLTGNGKPVVEPEAPYLAFSKQQLAAQREKLANQLAIPADQDWLYVHAGSGGSANNLSLEQYAALICGLVQDKRCQTVLTAGPGESGKAGELQQLLAEKGVPAVIYDRNGGLEDFTLGLACAGMFVAGSTGPLHIAATLDVPTIGFFPSKRSATPLRWQPVNSQGNHLAFAPPVDKDKEVAADMSKIAVADILPRARDFIADRLG